jgi:hypothetical protein
MKALAPFVVHVAAPPVGMMQSCAACGFVLTDNAAWAEGRVAVMDGDDGGPSWWPVGERIATDRTGGRSASTTYVIGPEGRPLADDERLCAGAN